MNMIDYECNQGW